MLPLGSHLELIHSVACSRQPARSPGRPGSLPPAPSMTHSLHTQPLQGLIFPHLFYSSRCICRVLSSLWNPPASCSVLYHFDVLIFFSFLKKRLMAFLLVCLSASFARTLPRGASVPFAWPSVAAMGFWPACFSSASSHLSVQQAIWLYLFWLSTSLLLLFLTFLHFHQSMSLTEMQFLN